MSNRNSNVRILIKSLRLESDFIDYKIPERRDSVFRKFEDVWGTDNASHFLVKYSDAESLLWKLDDNNLKLFIEKY